VMARRAAASGASMQPAYAGANVGSEASVRYAPLPTDAQGGGSAPVVQPASLAAAPSGPWGVPADFDVEGFLRNAKVQFVRLQAAYDAADLNDLREFTSPEMFGELRLQIHERGPSPNKTDVVKLDAELLGVETTQTDYMASVRFNGLVRESESSAAQTFDEVWNLVKPMDGTGGWVLAGIQQLN
jgi:predicted lipid-binding transport protein (Tim44 family)